MFNYKSSFEDIEVGEEQAMPSRALREYYLPVLLRLLKFESRVGPKFVATQKLPKWPNLIVDPNFERLS